jgi:predicted nucleic acid-binding protein
MILVDSSVWIDYFNGTATEQTDLLHGLLGQELVVIGDLILTEVLQGFRRERDFKKARQLLDTLILREMLGKQMAIKSAQNYRRLRAKGVTVRRTIDIIIATFCIESKLPLLHSDKDFMPMVKHLGLKSVL